MRQTASLVLHLYFIHSPSPLILYLHILNVTTTIAVTITIALAVVITVTFSSKAVLVASTIRGLGSQRSDQRLRQAAAIPVVLRLISFAANNAVTAAITPMTILRTHPQ